MRFVLLYIAVSILFVSNSIAVEEEKGSTENVWQAYYGPSGGRILSLALAPSDPKVLYATTQNSLYRSNDGAETWIRVADKRAYSQAAITVHPKKPDTLIVAGNKLEMSEDGGKTWRDFPFDAGKGNVFSICFTDGDKPGVVALAGNKAFRSTDDGKNWKQVHEVDMNNAMGMVELTSDLRCPNTLFIKSQYAARWVDFSLNGGETWKRYSPPKEGQVRGIGIYPDKKDVLIYVNENGVAYFSANAGETWEVFYYPNDEAFAKEEIYSVVRAIYPNLPKSQMMGYMSGNRYAIDPKDSRIVYYASWNGGIRKTVDGGNTWQGSQEGIVATEIKMISSPTNEAGMLCCSATTGTYIIGKGEKKWRPVEIKQTQDDYNYMGGGVIAVDPAKKSRMLLGDMMGRTFVTEDDGKSWVQFAHFELPANYNRILGYFFLPDEKDTFIAVAMSGIFKCNCVSGITTRVSEFLTDEKMQVWGLVALFNPKDMKTVFLAHNSWGAKCKRSSDGGKTWKEIKMPFSPQMTELPTWDISPDGSVFGIGNGEIWKLPADSEEWKKLGSPRKNLLLTSLTVSRRTDGIIYAGDTTRNVWITADGGKSWKNLGHVGDDITCLFEHPADGALFAGTRSSGVMAYLPPSESSK